jgi:hypothetical protein
MLYSVSSKEKAKVVHNLIDHIHDETLRDVENLKLRTLSLFSALSVSP